MNVAGSTTLAVAPAALRALLEDPGRLSALLPNVDAFGWTDGPVEGSFAVTIRPALALGEIPVRTVWERRPAADGELRYRVEGRTDEQRLAFDVVLVLGDAGAGGDGGTRVSWSLDCHVTGVLRSVGQRVLVPIVDRQVREVLRAAEGGAGAKGAAR
ncbi:CoxG family protein [Conexibacter woesei]|uniref:Carbon monoxide dehydrogenase subunit G n=1 Tax=Conexibacter woesei (strain DSM 14684 / CCUG 47730 / CIP 108061 / JCM 11494 / NBRC 100937 / ID131577) TaxID=469383 RepID=D3F2M0_CONWI|nr:SRPBCC domain-containing protein [Conexibacter woesei]ADB52286.1 carbon monoxide dehydrogenase subunit G [Conexibacter woesei DSM 14684]